MKLHMIWSAETIVNKWNNIFEAMVSFVKLVRDRKDARYHKEELERKQEDLIEGDETMGQQSA